LKRRCCDGRHHGWPSLAALQQLAVQLDGSFVCRVDSVEVHLDGTKQHLAFWMGLSRYLRSSVLTQWERGGITGIQDISSMDWQKT
jgi:hypothetical protein